MPFWKYMTQVLDSKPVGSKSQQPSQQQQRWRPTSPNPRSTPLHHQQERELSVRGGQYNSHSSTAGTRACSRSAAGVGIAQCASRRHSPQSAAATMSKQGQLDTTQWGFQLPASEEQVVSTAGGGPQHTRRLRSPQSPTGFFMRGSSAGAAANNYEQCSRDLRTYCTSAQHTAAGPGQGSRTLACVDDHHSSCYRSWSLNLEPPLGTSSHHMSERLTLTRPYVFRWGGRINSKHKFLCELHGTTGPSFASASNRRSGVSAADDSYDDSSKAAQTTRQAVQEAEVLAAAAELGARADRLLKVLQLRAPQQVSKKRTTTGRLRQSWQLDSVDPGDEQVYQLRDEVIGVKQEYLRL